MQRDLDRLERERFDLLIVGGGISGACLAHDAALRGLSVALIEKDDFGGATSAASSKVLHGGIRYLQQGRLDKIRESALERAAFQAIAPHLTRYVPFVIPTYPGLTRGRLALGIGLRLYDLLCAGQNRMIPDPAKYPPRSSQMSRDDLLQQIPAFPRDAMPTGAGVLYESHMWSSERMTLAFVKSAAAHGAVVANYVTAEKLRQTGSDVNGVDARCGLTSRPLRIEARLTANAAGPWIRGLNEERGAQHLNRPVTGFSKGAHIVTRAVTRDLALALPTARKAQAVVTRGGRHVFVIPWRGHSLIGTTDGPFQGTLDDVNPAAEDITDLLTDVNSALPGASLTPDDVVHAFAGLYPLTEAVLRDDVYQGTGEYQIVDHQVRDGIGGCMTVLGAKFTTARRLAERAVDLAVRKLGRAPVACLTHSTPLTGGAIPSLPAFVAESRNKHRALPDDVLTSLISSYGTEIDDVMGVAGPDSASLRRLTPRRESIEAEVMFALDQEMALRLDDVVFRRTGLGTLGHPGTTCLERCAVIIGGRLGWGAERMDEEIRRTERRFPVRLST